MEGYNIEKETRTETYKSWAGRPQLPMAACCHNY